MKLAEIFCDNMILQWGSGTQIFGEGEGSGFVEFSCNRVEFEANNGRFIVDLPYLNLGDNFDMVVSLEDESVTIKNILVGEVFLAGGQSNMELTLADAENTGICDLPMVRVFEVKVADENETSESGWQICCGDVSKISAVAYYFAQRLQSEVEVPIGIISCNQGASRIHSWVSKEVSQKPIFKKSIDLHNEKEELYKFNLDNFLYYNKLLKIVPYTIKGALWYQGESNAVKGEAEHYCEMFSELVFHWRSLWKCDLPFYTVQLMPYIQGPWLVDWAMVRKQQERASKTIPDVYMVTLFDTGETDEIHPKKKRGVGLALADCVLNTLFNRTELEYSGPVLREWKKKGHTAELVFDHTKELMLDCDWCMDTYIYDSTGQHYEVNERTAKAKIAGNRLIVEWGNELDPIGIKMGYWNAPNHKLKNECGYLASPFDVRF